MYNMYERANKYVNGRMGVVFECYVCLYIAACRLIGFYNIGKRIFQ